MINKGSVQNFAGYMCSAIGFAFFGDMLGYNVVASAVVGFLFGFVIMRFAPSATDADEAESRWRDMLANQIPFDEFDAGVRGIRRRWADKHSGDVVEAVRIFEGPEGYSGYPTLQDALESLVSPGEYYIVESKYSTIENSSTQTRRDPVTMKTVRRHKRMIRRGSQSLRVRK